MSNSRAFPAGNSVESFGFDPIQHRLAVTSHHGIIKMYQFNNGKTTSAYEVGCLLTSNLGGISDLWEERVEDAIPRGISFADKGNSVMIYGLETGAV